MAASPGRRPSALNGSPAPVPEPSLFDLFDAPEPYPVRYAPVPVARITDAETAHMAAASITERAQHDAHAKVLALLAEHGPLSDFDLARLTGRKQTSVGVRRGELVTIGLVVAHDRAGVSDTGSPCTRWALTAQEVAA
jgi:hypothetical protein